MSIKKISALLLAVLLIASTAVFSVSAVSRSYSYIYNYALKVKMDISSDFDSQLSTAFAAGEGPTMILSSSAYRFTYGDYLQDVSDVFDKTDLNKDDFIQSYLDYC